MKRADFIRGYIALFIANEKNVGLSQEQVDRLGQILEMCNSTCLKLNAQIETAEKALNELLWNIDDKTDKKVIIKKTKALYALKAKLELAHFQLLGKAEELLTDNQKNRLKEITHPPVK